MKNGSTKNASNDFDQISWVYKTFRTQNIILYSFLGKFPDDNKVNFLFNSLTERILATE